MRELAAFCLAIWLAACGSGAGIVELDGKDGVDLGVGSEVPGETVDVRIGNPDDREGDVDTWSMDGFELLFPEVVEQLDQWGPDCSEKPAPFGCPCTSNEECQSAYCIETQKGKQCSEVCVETCPPGFVCGQVVGVGIDPVFLCVDPFVQLCRPCKDSEVCWGGQCVEYGKEAGFFCGAQCEDPEDCPAGFECSTMESGANQCVRTDLSCSCSKKSVDEGAETVCTVTNENGTCGGKRVCKEAGEEPVCLAPVPAAETCDAADNDCDGMIDENPPACDGGRLCLCTGDSCACVCPEGWSECGGQCVNTQTSQLHCGKCDAPCTGLNVKVAVCDLGLCKITGCDNGWADGDDTFETGCECPVAAETCDGKDNDCNGQIDEGASLCGGTGECQGQCIEAQCVCPEGCSACDGVCKPDIFFETSPENCGGCGKGCSLPGTLVHGCSGGKCTPLQCAAGFKDCDEEPDNGCEFTVLPEECNGFDDDCDKETDELPLDAPCPLGMICKQGACECPAGKKACGGVCADVLTSKDHCGDCFIPCTPEFFPGVFSATCVQGECTPGPCLPNWVDTYPEQPGCECQKTSVLEKCDGMDNDCDGAGDEEPFSDCKPPMLCQKGVCICDPLQPSLLLCGNACFDALVDVNHCGDCDTDCEALGWPAVKPYACIQGLCAIGGCDAPFVDVDLDPGTGCECMKTSPVETCDGVDNDCDGEVDEDANGVGQVCNTGMAAPCANGTFSCGQGILSCVPDVLPGTFIEECDGVDNDCDGIVDNNVPQAGLPCAVPGTLGPCVDGTLQCLNAEIVCVSLYVTTSELCDGVDSDCNGVADDKPADADQPCPTGLPGLCIDGTTECKLGQIECIPDVAPGELQEKCNGLDDDCDSTADDGEPESGLACVVPGKLGECAKGMSKCVAGKVECLSDYVPADEICDGLDNDCNGKSDETVPGAGEACAVPGAQGECANGQMLCGPDGLYCKQLVQSAPETCDAKDNNCNGVADDGNPEGGAPCVLPGLQGLCKDGIVQCQGGKLQCQQVVFSTSESCDGKDNDCNGQVDNNPAEVGNPCNVPGANGPCQNGSLACQGGAPYCKQIVFPGVEFCGDWTDNNCNGQTDEQGAQGCSTYYYDGDSDGYASNNAQSQCLCSPSNGYTTTQKGDCADWDFNVKPGAQEQCDNDDDNCNGTKDDGAVCPGGFPCVNGSCCQSHASTTCSSGDVYYQSSCGQLEDKKEECANCSCSNGSCVYNAQYTYNCVGNDVYWMDCKNNYGSKKESCGNCTCAGNDCSCPSYTIDGCTGSNYVSGCKSYCQGCITENGFTAFNEAGCSGLTCFTRYQSAGYNGIVVMYTRSSSQTAYVQWAFPKSLSGNYKIWADIPNPWGLPAPSGCAAWNPAPDALYHIKVGSNDVATKSVNHNGSAGSSVLLFQGDATGVDKVTLGNKAANGNCGHMLVDRLRAEPY